MKITKTQLKQIIKEEISNAMEEGFMDTIKKGAETFTNVAKDVGRRSTSDARKALKDTQELSRAAVEIGQALAGIGQRDPKKLLKIALEKLVPDAVNTMQDRIDAGVYTTDDVGTEAMELLQLLAELKREYDSIGLEVFSKPGKSEYWIKNLDYHEELPRSITTRGA